MFSKSDLKNYLEEISTAAKFVKLDFVSTEKFRIELKCKVEKDATPEFYSQYSGAWIKKFSKFTATTWIVRNCFPRLKRLLYRKVFACHRSAFNKKTKPNFETRNQECKAKIEFKMKFINRNTIKNDPFLKDGLNLTISIDFSHTHKVRAPESFHFLKSTSETDNKFEQYFNTGCVGVAAKYYHELTLIDKYGENCSEILSNANINPSLRHVLYLYGKWKKEAVEIPNFRNIMNNKKEHLENNGFTISFTENPETIVIITPVMKRVTAEFGLECLLVDSTCVPNGPIASFYYVPSKIGALPIACVIHSELNKTDYFQAFYSVKLVLEMEFSRSFEPEMLMMNNLDEQRHIASLYPKSKLVLCRYVKCCEAWRWLNDDDHKVERKKRHSVMALIKSLVYADTLETADKAYSVVNENEYVTSIEQIREYVENLWQSRAEWQIFNEDASRYNMNLVEATIRFTKEFLSRRCKSFNKYIMVDVVANILENQFRRVLNSHLKENRTRIYTKFLSKAKIVLGFGSDVQRIGPNEFRVERQQKPKKYLYFRTDTMCCDCLSGKKGQFCEHLCAIINIADTEMMKMPTLTEDDKLLYAKLAGGDVDEENDAIKPELDEDDKSLDSDDKDEIDKQDFSDTQDMEQLTSVDSSHKSETDNDYYNLEVKTERCDPLETDSDNHDTAHDNEYSVIENMLTNDVPVTHNRPDIKRTYEIALKAVNDEFRRLNRFFIENPNSSNLETMTRLARELSKIRPVERINLTNMNIKLNNTRKRKRS